MIKIGTIAPKRSGHGFVGNMVKSWTNEICYHDFENFIPEKFARSVEARNIDVVILSTRDLLNWFASYLALKEQRTGKVSGFDNMVRKWLAITREFYGVTNYLKDLKVHRVLYDRFVVDQDYRKKLCEDLGFRRYNEAMMDVVAVGGRGSSFSGFSHDGTAGELGVLERYRQFKHENVYRKLFDHFPDLYEFYKKYMGNSDKVEFIDEIRS